MESSSIVARSLAQIFQCATLSGATHKLTYIHIYTYVTDRWRQTPVAVFCPFSLGKYAAVRLPQDKYESTPFLCLTTQRNLLLLQTPPQTHTFLHTSQDETQLYSHFPNSVLKCRLLCFSLFFFFVFPPAMKNSENLIHLVTHSGAHKKISEIKISSSNQKFKGEPCFQ